MSQYDEESKIEVVPYITFLILVLIWYFLTGLIIAILFGFINQDFWATDQFSRNFIVWPMNVIWAIIAGAISLQLLTFEWFFLPLTPIATYYIIKKGYGWKSRK